MSVSAFHKKILKSIADESLQAALDGNAIRRTQGRLKAFESLPDHQLRRQAAHRIRMDVISHLDKYLSKFISKLEGNGFQVHRAKDGNEAIRIFLEIAGKHDARLVAKSKSMVSEEIGLNHALQLAGLEPVETDLGEYIVQLRGERPSHIITPAVHLRRHEVGALFHEKLGVPYTEEIPVLTNIARKVLRQVFLEAQIGMSGVNFGVAETGTLCTVTNEGNGRMVTTVPPVHIALMGMERLLPNLDDLALFLSLLPRSATGQKLSVYTSLIHGPRRTNEQEGALERHLILVDNGRSRLLNTDLQEALLCIRCGACLNACPVFREIGGHGYVGKHDEPAPYPGPIGSVVSPGLCGNHAFGHLAQASSLCGACKEACPVDIDLPSLLLRVRAGAPDEKIGGKFHGGVGLPPWLKPALKVFRLAAMKPGRFKLALKTAAFGARIFSPRSQWMKLPAFTGWGASRDMPRPASRSFHSRWQSIEHATTQTNHSIDISIEPESITTPFISDLAARFAQEMDALGGKCIRCTSDELQDKIFSLLKERDTQRLMVDDYGQRLLANSNMDLVTHPDPTCKVGLSLAEAGMADTGSLLFTSGKDNLLSAGLLPEVHIAILDQKNLRNSLPEVLNTNSVRQASNAVVVTGPSRTADIEMTLTIGVHGPGELIVFLVKDRDFI